MPVHHRHNPINCVWVFAGHVTIACCIIFQDKFWLLSSSCLAVRIMAHLRVFKQQQGHPVIFQWYRRTTETVPLVGEFVGEFRQHYLHTDRPLVAFTPDGLREPFWILKVLWNGFNNSECMLLFGSVQNASAFRFGVILQEADDYVRWSGMRTFYHHHNTEFVTGISGVGGTGLPRSQHLIKANKNVGFDFPEVQQLPQQQERRDQPAFNSDSSSSAAAPGPLASIAEGHEGEEEEAGVRSDPLEVAQTLAFTAASAVAASVARQCL